MRISDWSSDVCSSDLHWGVPESQVEFLPGFVRVGNQKVVFADFIEAAYMARVSLSSTGFYKTPKIHWDRKAGKGRPFYYYSSGAAASEVVVAPLTGEYRVERADILPAWETGRAPWRGTE